MLGGAGLVQGWRLVRARLRGTAARAVLAIAVVVCLVLAVGQFTRLNDSMTGVLDEAEDNGTLPDLIAAAGGRDGIVDCGLVYTRGFQTQLMAWELRVPERGVALGPGPSRHDDHAQGRAAAGRRPLPAPDRDEELGARLDVPAAGHDARLADLPHSQSGVVSCFQ